MEVVELEEIKDKRIRSLDTAQVLASVYTQEERENYSLSSQVIAQVIKQKGLGSKLMPDEGEVAIIKTLKKDDSVAYGQLVKDVFRLLQTGEELSELQQIRHRRVRALDKALQDKQKELFSLEEKEVQFDRCLNCSRNFRLGLGGTLLILLFGVEVVVLIITGVFSISSGGVPPCWSSE